MRTGQKLSPNGRVNLIDTRQAEERFQQRGRGAVSNQTGRFEAESMTRSGVEQTLSCDQRKIESR